MIVFVLIAELIFWSPVLVCSILALTINPWFWTASGSIIAFWAGPFTPAVPLQIGLAIFLKKLWQIIRKKWHKKETIKICETNICIAESAQIVTENQGEINDNI